MTESIAASEPAGERLKRLAEAHGVSTEYWDYHGNLAAPSRATLVAVLAALGVDAGTDEEVEASLMEADLDPWRLTLPRVVVTRAGSSSSVPVHLPDGASVRVRVELEGGGRWDLSQTDEWTLPHDVDGALTGRACFALPADLPLGWHTLVAEIDASPAREAFSATAPLAVTPERLELPAALGLRGWGAMAQLYSVRSHGSWGIGDADDLTELVSFLGDEGADFLLINPLHAAEPAGRMTPSPYLPVTRRFVNPIYIRPEAIGEVARLSGPRRSLVQWAFEEVSATDLSAEPIDRDAVWKAKREALEVIFAAGRSRARQRDFERFRATEGQGLEDFALWCALRERYGEDFPEELSSPATPHSALQRLELAERIDFFAWLQWIVDTQLEDAQREALDSGMALGIFHDLAVGVHSKGADVWSNPGIFASGVTVGAPPDVYNQHGQNWSQPPWSPVALRESAYAPLRNLVHTVLRHAGGLRVDHVMGLFRQWWIPAGNPPSEGAYVRFDHEAAVGILMLEAYRAGAVVVGEDLGNVEPWVRDYMRERGILGTSVLWFEAYDDGTFKQPWDLRRETLVTVDTHDLPPVAGYLAGEHVDLRDRLGVLAEPVEKVRADAELERQRMMSRLAEHGLIDENSSEREIIEAMHRYIARSPGELLAIALVDAVGERRAQNQPGTDEEYPNWRLPLADGSEQVVLVEDLKGNPRLRSLVTAFVSELHTARQ